MNPSTKKPEVSQQIRQFLLVVFMGIAAGVLLVLFLVNHYGPTGQYRAKNTLLAPQTLTHLWYSDTNPKTGGNSRYVFQDIEWIEWNASTKESTKHALDEAQYEQFYQLIAQDQSLLNPGDEVVRLFEAEPSIQIAINVKTESSAEWQAVKKIFQLIQISSDGNHYRIQLHEDKPGTHWAYFEHPGIYQKTLSLLKP